MKHFIRPTEYDFLETLATDVATGNVSERYLSMSFDVEPMKISDAPNDVPLVLVSNEMTIKSTSSGLPLAKTLLMGSVVMKLSKETVLLTEEESVTSQDSLFYSEVSYFRTLGIRNQSPVTELKSYHGELHLTGMDAYVVPVSAVRSYGIPLFGRVTLINANSTNCELATT